MSLAISKKIVLLTIVSFCSIFSFAQNNENDDLWLNGLKLKDNSVVYPDKILFKTDTDVFFQLENNKYYKLPLSLLGDVVDCKTLSSSKFGDFLLKYVKQSQTGITLSIIGSTGTVILPFFINKVAVLVVPPIISLTGFIIWASSYSHLKKYAIIDSAIDYK
jgi:hypothetical protein